MTIKKITYKLKFQTCFGIILFITITTLSLLMYMNVKTIMINETTNTNKNTIIQLKNATEIMLKETDRALMQISFDSSIESMMDEINNLEYKDFINIYERLTNVLSSNTYLTSCYVYYFNSNKVIDVNALFPVTKSIDDLSDDKKDLIYNLRDQYSTNNQKDLLNLYSLKLDQHGQNNVLAMIKPINAASTKPKALLIVTINPAYFDDSLNAIKIDANGSVFIVDKEDKVISKINKQYPISYDYVSNNTSTFKHNEGTITAKIGSESHLVSYITSDLLHWKFVYTIPTKAIYGKLVNIRTYILLLWLLCLLLAEIISVIFIRKLYNPIKDLTKLIKKNAAPEEMYIKDDITYINQNLNYLISKNKTLEASLNESMPILKNSLLSSILKNHYVSELPLWEKLNFYSVSIQENSSYFVCVLSIDQYDSYICSYTEQQINLLEIYQRELILDICSKEENTSVEIVKIDTNSIVLVFSTAIKYREYIYQLISVIHKELVKHIKFTLSVGIGSVYNDISKIYLSYNEALAAHSYKVIKGNNQIIFNDEIPKFDDWQYIYPYELERDISYYLKQGNEATLMDALSNYFEYARNNITKTTDIKYAFIHLLDITIKTTVEISININEFSLEKGNLYNQLLSKETIQDAFDWFKSLFVEIISYIGLKKENKLDEIFQKTKQYLDNNFMSENISLDLLSEEMHFSISYLGKLFKDAEGISIKEYITQKRIEMAKRLLQDTNLKIKEIGEDIGYVNDRSFINIFKKYVGDTPGEYRDRYIKKIL